MTTETRTTPEQDDAARMPELIAQLVERPRFSIYIPSLGAFTLPRTLESVLEAGANAADQIILVADTHDPEARGRMTMLAGQWRLKAERARGWKGVPAVTFSGVDAGRHNHGNPQRARGVEVANDGTWLVAQDEDDVFTPGIFDTIRAHIIEARTPAPHLYRFEVYVGGRRLMPVEDQVIEAQIDGHSIVAPKLPGLVGTWTERYESDYDFMASTLAQHGGTCVWHPEVIGVARPHLDPRSELVPA